MATPYATLISERRAQPRARGPFDGFWDGASIKTGRIADLSIDGCFIESVIPAAQIGQCISVSISIGGGQINVVGEVLYVQGNQGFACRFHNPSVETLTALQKEIDARPP